MALPIPLLLAGLLTAGSIGANAYGARQQDQARGAALAGERRRQNQFHTEAMGVNDRARDRYKDMAGQQEDRAGDLTDLYRAPAAETTAPNLPESNSGITVAYEDSERDKARAETDDRATKRADLMSFGDIFGDINRGMSRDAGDLSMVRGFQQGSLAPHMAELDAASYKGQGWRTAGDIMGLGAAVATPFALSGNAAPAWMSNLFGGGAAPAATAGAPMTAMRPMPRPNNLMGLYG